MRYSTYFLAQQELAFRDYNESNSSVNRGNYVELIYLITQRDELLKTIILQQHPLQ